MQPVPLAQMRALPVLSVTANFIFNTQLRVPGHFRSCSDRWAEHRLRHSAKTLAAMLLERTLEIFIDQRMVMRLHSE